MRRYIGAILTILVCVACGTQAAKKTYTQRERKHIDLSILEEDVEFHYFNGEWIRGASIEMVNPDSIIDANVGDDEYGNRVLFVTLSPLSLDSLKKKAAEATYGFFPPHPYVCEFPEGHAKMLQWVKDNIRIPDGFKGRERVVVSFTVLPNGRVTDGKILRGSENEDVNAEALRLVNALPKFYVKYYTPKKEPIHMAWPIMFEANDSID